MTSSFGNIEDVVSSPKALVNFLQEWRFKDNAVGLVHFLLQAIDQLPDVEKIAEDLNSLRNTEKAEDGDSGIFGELQMLPSAEDVEEKVETLTISSISPRSKLHLSIFQNGLTFTSPKGEKIEIPSGAVNNLVFFPKREDCLMKPKLTGDGKNMIISGSQVLVIFKRDRISFRNKKLSQLCFRLPDHLSQELKLIDDSYSSKPELIGSCFDKFQDEIVKLISSSLSLEDRICQIHNPQYESVERCLSYSFQSVDSSANTKVMQGKMPFLKCFHGVNDGVIYPMEQGLLFFKPPLFIHRSKLHSISVGGAGGSRYIDLNVTLDEGDGGSREIHFTNIDREEIAVLKSYIHNILVKAMTKDVGEKEFISKHANMIDSLHDKASGQHQSRRSLRQAALDSIEITKGEINEAIHSNLNTDDDSDDEIYEVIESVEESDNDDDDFEDYELVQNEVDTETDEESEGGETITNTCHNEDISKDTNITDSRHDTDSGQPLCKRPRRQAALDSMELTKYEINGGTVGNLHSDDDSDDEIYEVVERNEESDNNDDEC